MKNIFSKIKKIYNNKSLSNATKKIRGYKEIDGWLTENEAIGLFSIAKKLGPNSTVVEIGSWKGKSTYCIAKGLRQGNIHCIDPFNADGEEGSKELYEKTKGSTSLIDTFKANLSEISPAVIIKTHQGYSQEFVNTIHNIDFLFIDGNHSIEGCRFDFEHYAKDLKVKGYLAFHDYYADRNDLGPTWVIDNLVTNNSSYQFFKKFDSLSVFRKIN